VTKWGESPKREYVKEPAYQSNDETDENAKKGEKSWGGDLMTSLKQEKKEKRAPKKNGFRRVS